MSKENFYINNEKYVGKPVNFPIRLSKEYLGSLVANENAPLLFGNLTISYNYMLKAPTKLSVKLYSDEAVDKEQCVIRLHSDKVETISLKDVFFDSITIDDNFINENVSIYFDGYELTKEFAGMMKLEKLPLVNNAVYVPKLNYQDITPPTVEIDVPDFVFKPFVATFTLSEGVVGFSIDDINIIGGTKSNFQLNGLVATCEIDPTGVPYGDFPIVVESGAFSDVANNTVIRSSVITQHVQPDGISPELSITTESTLVTGAFDVVFTFNEAVKGFEQSDIELTNGVFSNFKKITDSVYSGSVAPSVVGSVVITVGSAVCTDVFDNNNIGDTLEVTYTDEYLFNTYQPLYAWFFYEKLNVNANKIFDLRRASDNSITTVFFGDSRYFGLHCKTTDGSALSDWVGSSDAFIVKSYDQMGSGLNAVQNVQSKQVKIISNGALVLENGKPSGLFNGSQNYKVSNFNPQTLRSLMLMLLMSEDLNSTNTVPEVILETTEDYVAGSSGFLVYQNLSSETNKIRVSLPNGNVDALFNSNTKLLTIYTDLDSGAGGFYDTIKTFVNNSEVVSDGTADVDMSFTIKDLFIGARGNNATLGYQGTIHGFAVFNGAEFANRRLIEGHFQTSFPNIFGQPDVLGSGNVNVLSQMDANIVFDGNSLTEGVNGSGVSQYYPKKVKEWLMPKTKSLEFHGLGISGYKMTEMRDNFNTRILPLVNQNKTNILVFGEDANDLLGGHVTAQQNFDLAVEYAQKAKDAGFNKVILWTGWYPRTAQQSQAILDEQEVYFDLVKNVDINTVPWDVSVDMRTHNSFRWGKLPYNPPLTQVQLDEQNTLFSDYLHLKALGYDKLAEHVINEGLLKIFTL